MYHNIQDDLVSIIVPVYNVQEYVERCIKSLQCQTYKNIEIILVNDGSTDASPEICMEYQKKDDRIIFVSKKNERQGPSRNFGVHLSHGKYIFFVDADDYIDETAVEKLYERAVRTKSDLVVCDYYRRQNGKYQKLISSYDIPGTTCYNESPYLLYNISSGILGKIFDRELLIENDILMSSNFLEDSEIFAEYLVLAKRIAQVKEALYYYDVDREGNTSTTGLGQVEGFPNIVRNIKHFFEKKQCFEKVCRDLEKYLTKLFIYTFYYDGTKIERRLCVTDELYNKGVNTMKEVFPNWKDLNLEKMLLIGNPSLRTMVMGINGYSSYFSALCLKRYNFSSLIAMMDSEGELEDSVFQKVDNSYRREMLDKEFHRRLIQEDCRDIPYILVDLQEERFDIIKYKGHYYTYNMELQQISNELGEYEVIQRDTEVAESLWKDACDRFIQWLDEKEMKVYLMESYVNQEMRDYGSGVSEQKMNKILKEYYNYLKNGMRINHIIWESL